MPSLETRCDTICCWRSYIKPCN